MNWSTTTVLVTGAGGFIGSHLVDRLVQLGARTRALVHYNSERRAGWLDRSARLRDVELVFGDVRDADSIGAAFANTDVVFHLAALIGIPYSYVAPSAYLRTNAAGTMNVLNAALASGSRLVIHTSTSEVYGTARSTPIDEGHPLQAQSPYAASKIAADKLAESFHLSFGLPVVTLRPFNTFGPRQSGRAVIPTVISQALDGAELRLGNLEPRRDLNYVLDTVEAYVLAAGAPSAVGTVLNIGSGRDVSVRELATLVLRLMGVELPIVQDENRVRPEHSEVLRLVADSGRARDLLGWRSTWSLEDGLARTIDWMEEHRSTFEPNVYAI